MKIVLLDPVGSGIPHLGLLFLSAALKQAGFKDTTFCSIDTASNSFERSEEFFLKQLEEKPLVLITATVPIWVDAVKYAKIAKEKGCFVIVGGPAPTTFGKKILEKYSFIDVVVKGEGELIIGDIAKATTKNDFTGIRGVIWKKDGTIIENEENTLIRDLDSLPFPDYAALDFKSYHGPFAFCTSRGCPYGCEFCFKPIHGRMFRSMSPERVLEQMKWIIKTFPAEFEKVNRTIGFSDDIFNFDMERAEKIAKMIIDQKLNIKMVSVNGFHVRHTNEAFFRLMKKAGFVEIWFGIDAGSEVVLKNLRKGITLDMVRQAVKRAKKAGILTIGGHFIIGLRGDTLEHSRAAIAFIKSIPFDEVGLTHANVLPGTELWDYVKEHGTLLHETDGFDFSAFWQLNHGVIFETSDFPKADRIIAYEEATKVMNYIRRRHIMKPGRVIKLIKDIHSPRDIIWVIGRAFTFITSKDLRARKRKPRPSEIKKVRK
ncbi:MAG: radical SAM protein [Candidatus Diapherotrites archaeon]|nr:radical SAM protein [Candidatus Diapherotrites archaeon]